MAIKADLKASDSKDDPIMMPIADAWRYLAWD